jgi:CHASE3 domain sensor protein
MRTQIENAIMDAFLFIIAVLLIAGAVVAVFWLVDSIKTLVRGL